ncbi:MAG: Ubiquinol-cytochrome C reductase, cytochrome C1 subunit [Fluviibacter phosphoraccumulans EoVTN8]
MKMKSFFAALIMVPALAFASGAEVHLDKAPNVQGDNAALQNGARLFVNYCQSCHGASFIRYEKLMELGLSEQQIKDNLMFTGDKIGDTMKIAMRPDEAKKWFGATPPDLTMIARARASGDGSGADWLYTYLRSFYKDDARPTGWNNVVFANVGMPNVLWQLQGVQALETVKEENGKEHHKLVLVEPGQLTPEQFDKQVADLVGFLVWMGEPGAGYRKAVGAGVLIFLAVLFVAVYALKKNYWKDIH